MHFLRRGGVWTRIEKLKKSVELLFGKGEIARRQRPNTRKKTTVVWEGHSLLGRGEKKGEFGERGGWVRISHNM